MGTLFCLTLQKFYKMSHLSNQMYLQCIFQLSRFHRSPLLPGHMMSSKS